MLKSSFASRSTSPTSPSCRSPSRSHSLPRRCRWRSTRRRTGATMADERRILLVEDDVLIGMMLVDMLDTLGYPEPAQAAAIDEALAIVDVRSEEHTSELQSLMRISYAVFCLKKTKQNNRTKTRN